jgi:hypothetical protein
MTKDSFLFIDKIELIKRNFISNGWLTIHEVINSADDESIIYCGLVKEHEIALYRTHHDWEIDPGVEGKPSVYTSQQDGFWTYEYQSYADDSLEPFIFSKRFLFDGGDDSYVDVSEDFILYFKLYEKGTDKRNRKFHFIDELGQLDEVIVITEGRVKIKLRYLKEYITIRKVYFSVCFNFLRIADISLLKDDVVLIDKNFQDESYCYNHFIRILPSDELKLQGWIHGKAILDFDKSGQTVAHFDRESCQYEEFITGYDDNGMEILQSCKRDNEKMFLMTFFRKEVLNKYYADPRKYKVTGFNVMSDFFVLKIDNNLSEYVPVFLTELGSLPHKEQIHWKQYNIGVQEGMSRTYYQTMIEGKWASSPETLDLLFKEEYLKFNKKWLDRYGWYFYKPLSAQNSHNFDSLHIPTTNNEKTFCDQILSLVIITIDSLNEKEITKGLELEPNAKGIRKLELFLESRAAVMPDMITFLRHLQNLRSGLVAHRFSNSNKALKETMVYFNLQDSNYQEVASEIFCKSLKTILTLNSIFLN